MSSDRSPVASPRSAISPATTTRVSLFAGVSVLVVIFLCYWPLTRYYLAQDDFILIERASKGFWESVSQFFHLRPGQFRPLTKGLYFFLTWPVFGLNATPYHITSLLLHAANAILVAAVLRRMGISVLVSWLAAVVFAVHMCHIEAIAWISCVQQLIGALFTFAALIFGFDALEGRGRHSVLKATIAYGLALCSYEQTLAAPFVLLAWAWIYKSPRDARLAARGPLLSMLVLFGVYAVYAFVLRGMPEKGPYVMSVGSNILDNLRDYAGIALSVWHVYPAYMLTAGIGGAVVAWIAIVTLHMVWRTPRDLMFGCIAFFAFLAPVMFTRAHTHSFHLYIPEIGVCFLVASLVESARRRAGERRRRDFAIAAICVTVAIAVGSGIAVRKNTTAILSERLRLPRIFVLRRAVIAERMEGEIRRLWSGDSRQLILAYPNPQLALVWRNIQSALGNGSAVRLWLEKPDLDVVFVPPAKLPETSDGQQILVFNELGYCFTVPEWNKMVERLEGGAGPK